MPVFSASSLSAIGPAAASRQRISRKPTPIDWMLRGLLELEMRIGDHLAELDHIVLDRFADQLGRAAHRLDALIERSEEHTSELQSPCNLVCRLLLEKKN